MSLKPDKVREDELFIHNYFTEISAHSKTKRKTEDNNNDDDDGNESEMDFAG